MQTTEVVSIGGRQAVKLPDEFRFRDTTVAIRKEGESVILEPVKSRTWPADFFAAIRIHDPAFARPSQGHCAEIPIGF